MIYIVVLVAVVVVPAKLGGYGAVFSTANEAFRAKGGDTGLILKPSQMLPYATLAFGSALAAFMYPHTLTGIFASKSADTIRKNAILLPAYTLLLGLIALLGYMAYAANIKVTSNNDVVPVLFKVLFPSWFAGFAFSAIAIGALVPAAVMSIGAANLFTRNVWKSYIDPGISHAGEAGVAKIASLVVKIGRARIYALSADAICARSAIAWGSMDTADLSGAGVGIVHALVPGGRSAAGLGGRNPLGIVDGVEQRVEAARKHQSRREQLHVLCRTWRADPQYRCGGTSDSRAVADLARPARRHSSIVILPAVGSRKLRGKPIRFMHCGFLPSL